MGVIGAGRCAKAAHPPGFYRSPFCELVTICDLDYELAEARAAQLDIPDVVTDYEQVLSRDDINVVDVVTRGDHEDLVFATLEAGKHCLVEKPVRRAWRRPLKRIPLVLAFPPGYRGCPRVRQPK